MHKGSLDIVFYVYTYIRSELVGFNLFAAYLCRTSINYNEPRAFSNLLIVLSVLSTLSTKSSLICTVVCHNHHHANLLVFFKVKTIAPEFGKTIEKPLISMVDL